ncbi:sugar phosphate isomerase/epimerase family protein [Niallia sp. 03133]|uniref:sugar phosphate isomerase/epimerase family protein n=1 Tax=Niallia sp. 03133 TaxID=3458060 RepID=UPI00404489C8
MKKLKIGVQLWTLHPEMVKDPVGTLRKVAEMGYEGVEFAHATYDGLPPEKMRSLLEELHLVPVAKHLGGYDAITVDLEKEMEYTQKVGSKFMVYSLMDKFRRDDEKLWKQALEDLAKAGEKCAENGIQFCYHNHEFEFTEKKNGKPILDVIFETLPEDTVKAELDAGWIFHGGCNPVDVINQYTGRLPMLHLKDMSATAVEREDTTVELGKGDVNLLETIDAAANAGAEWLVVEQDYCQNPPLVTVENSLNWLRKNYL